MKGRNHTSDSESAKVGMALVVEVPVILRDHRDKWEASLNGEMEGALLEWPYVMIRTGGTCSFRENPYRCMTPLYFFSGSLERAHGDRIIASIDEYGARSLHELTKEWHILERLFGHHPGAPWEHAIRAIRTSKS
jgi:hypothetical protein